MKNILIDVKKENKKIVEKINIYIDENQINKEYLDLTFSKVIKISIFNEEIEHSFLMFISQLLAEYILHEVEPTIIMKEVKEECVEFFSDEIEDIFQRVQWELIYKQDQETIKYTKKLELDIFEGLQKNGMFNLNGFLNFKYEERKLEIKEHVNIALDESLIDDDYNSFVNILRRLISIQKPKIDTVHVILLADDDCEVITGDNERVDIREVEDIWDEEVTDDQIQKELIYILMSLLMTLCPKEVVIHTNELQDPFIPQTLKKVYKNTVICNGCKLCNNIRETRET